MQRKMRYSNEEYKKKIHTTLPEMDKYPRYAKNHLFTTPTSLPPLKINTKQTIANKINPTVFN